MDLDNPREKQAYYHLLAHGAIKPIGEPVTNAVIKDKDAGEVNAFPASSVSPIPEEAEYVEEISEAPESETTEPVGGPLEESPDESEVEERVIGPGTALSELMDLEEMRSFTEEEIDTLKRIGIATIFDVSNRTDAEIKSVRGVGAKKVQILRTLNEMYGG